MMSRIPLLINLVAKVIVPQLVVLTVIVMTHALKISLVNHHVITRNDIPPSPGGS